MGGCISSARRAMRDTLLAAATMAPSLPLLPLCELLLFYPAVRTLSSVMHHRFFCRGGITGFGFNQGGGERREEKRRAERSRTRSGWKEARRGAADGATLALHRHGKPSSKDTGRGGREEGGGASRSFRVFSTQTVTKHYFLI